jgi:hypothetical protein
VASGSRHLFQERADLPLEFVLRRKPIEAHVLDNAALSSNRPTRRTNSPNCQEASSKHSIPKEQRAGLSILQPIKIGADSQLRRNVLNAIEFFRLLAALINGRAGA